MSENALKYYRKVRQTLEKLYGPHESKTLSVMLFEHYAGISHEDLIGGRNQYFDETACHLIGESVNRLMNHEPVQYILGKARFFDLYFLVNSHVLIPRPETEELVHWVITEKSGTPDLRVIDIGTGSGCIAISLAKHLHNAETVAVDISHKALEVAKQNGIIHNAKVQFIHCDITDSNQWPPGEFDVVVCNPPYIPYPQESALPRNVVNFEPWMALFPPVDDPLFFYRHLIGFALSKLVERGVMYLECHEEYADMVADLCSDAGLTRVKVKTDINGKNRMVKAMRAS